MAKRTGERKTLQGDGAARLGVVRAAAAPARAAAAPIRPPVPRPARAAGKRGFLLALSGPHLGEVFPLAPGGARVIGRRGDCDVALRDPGVARRHASVEVRGEGAVLRDLGGAGGTWVDGARVREATLGDGARVRLGAHTLLAFVRADDVEAVYRRQLAEGALLDPLTGLHDRRYLEERLGSELAAAQRHGRPVSLLLCDVDRLAAIHAAHGRVAGDEALKMVALVLRGAVRREDVLARYADDAFAVVARETPLDGAHSLAERIRGAIERSRCAWRGEDLGVTLSVGVTVSMGLAEFVPGRSEQEIVASADRALALAKQGGRNRVVALRLESRLRAS